MREYGGTPYSRSGERKAEGSQGVRATPASADFTKSVQPYWLCKTPTPFGVGVFLMRAVEGLAAARSTRGSDTPPGCHSLPLVPLRYARPYTFYTTSVGDVGDGAFDVPRMFAPILIESVGGHSICPRVSDGQCLSLHIRTDPHAIM